MIFNPEEDCEDVDANKDSAEGLGALIAKTAAVTFVTVAVFALVIMSIIVLVNPYGAMHSYYKLGLNEAALSSAEHYVQGQKRSRGINQSYEIFFEQDLLNDEFLTAQTTAIVLSEKLLNSAIERQDMKAARRYAESLERSTREYLSIYGIQNFNDIKSQDDMSQFTDVQLKSYVTDYTLTLQTRNYKARCVTGETDKMLYNNSISVSGNTVTDIVTDTTTQATTFLALTEDSLNDYNVNNFITYIAQLTEYVSYENARLYCGDVPTSEAKIPEKLALYRSNLSGNEFYTLMLKKGSSGTFTQVYNGMNSYRRYMNYVVERYSDNTACGAAKKLYAIRTLSEFCKQMDIMLYTVYHLSSAQYSAENLYTYEDAKRIQSEITYYKVDNMADSRWQGNRVYDYNGTSPLYLDSLYANLLRQYRNSF